MDQLPLRTRKGRGGRPTSYRPEYCRRIVELMAEGRSLEGCAALIGVHPDTLWEWHKVHPEFSEAVRAGRAASTMYWENRLLDVAQGGRGNAQAILWALRNRSRAASGWHHDIQKIEHVGPEGGPPALEKERILNVDGLTPEERSELKRLILKCS